MGINLHAAQNILCSMISVGDASSRSAPYQIMEIRLDIQLANSDLETI